MKRHFKSPQYRTLAAEADEDPASLLRCNQPHVINCQTLYLASGKPEPGGRVAPAASRAWVLCRKVVLVDGLDLSGANFQSEVTVSLLM